MQLTPPADPPPATSRPSPLQSTLFYGWVIVACAIANSFVGSGSSNVVLSVLLKPIKDQTGWSRTMIALSVSIGALGSAFISPIAGMLTHRFGGRKLIPIGGVICGSLYFIVAHTMLYPVFLLAHAANRTLGPVTMALVYDVTGSYLGMFRALTGCSAQRRSSCSWPSVQRHHL